MVNMSSSFEKSVKGATKYKAAPPKSKYIEHILVATHSEEAGVAEVFRALQHRLRDSTWITVFKSLITIHLMIREGSPDVTLSYLARHKNILAINNFSDLQTQGRNVKNYTNYLSERARAFRDTKCDFVRGATSRLEKLTVEKGLLRETEIVQHQIKALLKCDVLDNEPENEITITAFRLLVLDLLALFHTMNTGLIKILGHFFELSKVDANRALSIYKDFTHQTDSVVQYLSIARQYEHQTRVEVPRLKHAPTNLGKQLEDYLMDPEFDFNRRQYLKEQEVKHNRTNNNLTAKKPIANNETQTLAITRSSSLEQFRDKAPQPVKGPDPDLIDFFDSIEQKQQVLMTEPGPNQQPFQMSNLCHFPVQEHSSYQQNGFIPQQLHYQNPNQLPQAFGNEISSQYGSSQTQNNFITSEMNGYAYQVSFQSDGLSLTSANSMPVFPQICQQQIIDSPTGTTQITNPFRQSTKIPSSINITGLSHTTLPPPTSSVKRQSTNPFARSTNTPSRSFSPPLHENFSSEQQQQAAGLTPFSTGGTNPFAKPVTKNLAPQPHEARVQSQFSGNTNPFRQIQLVNTSSNEQQTIGGGFDNLETIPVFPRTIQQQIWP